MTQRNNNNTVFCMNYKNLLETIFILLFIGFLLYGVVVFYKVSSGWYSIENLTPIVITATSIVAGAFFTIRIYLENQLSITERKMLKEYLDKIEKLEESMEKKFDQKLKDQTTRQNAEITRLLNELVATGKITVNKQNQTEKS